MSNANPVSILSAFSTLKSMVDTKQYHNQYQILTEFIQYIILKRKIHSFTAIEMKNQLNEIFGFDIPEAVVRTSVRGMKFVKTEKGIHKINQLEFEGIDLFEEKKAIAESNNSDIIALLQDFVKKSRYEGVVQENQLTKEFIAYLLDDQQLTNIGKYTNLIGQFILKYENDKKVQSTLEAIREGSILYIGLNHNINETGSLKKPLTLFLGTEVLFSLYGYNGEIYKKLALDLYHEIQEANKGERRISLRYFSEVRKEIDDFFTSAEYIVDGKQLSFDTVAMKAIINGCSTSGDVDVKKADFFYKLRYTYGITEDECTTYYDKENDSYNLESLIYDPLQHEAMKMISHINKLREGKTYFNILDSGYLIVTNAGQTLRASREQVNRIKQEQGIEDVCDYAVSVEKLTNILWYKLGNGLGRNEYPTNVNAVLKARMLLASQISQNISRVYEEIKEEFNNGTITESQLASRIITLRKKPIIPEEISSETIEDSLDFSWEYLTRYEEEVKQNQDKLLEKDQRLQLLEEQKEKIISEKNITIAEKNQQIIDEKKRNTELQASLNEYRRKELNKEKKRAYQKKVVLFVLSIISKLILVFLIIVIARLICSRFDPVLVNSVSIAIGIIGVLPIIKSVLKKDVKILKDDNDISK